jgi:hypothetical protein
MTKEEYNTKLKKFKKDFEDAKLQVAKEYAKSNNPYKIGDVVTDHMGSIKIEKIGFWITAEFPECMYSGIELKKDGTSFKNKKQRTVWQFNIVKK